MKTPTPLVTLGVIALAGCAGDVTPPDDPANVTHVIGIDSGDQQMAPVATPLPEPVVVRVTDASGRGVPGIEVRFQVFQGGGWVLDDDAMLTDESGQASTVWYMGPLAGTTSVLSVTSEVGVTGVRAYTTPLVPGQTFRGLDGHVELRFGALPLMITAPHGGMREPAGAPDQDHDAASDAGTIELAGEIERAFADRGDGTPAVLVSHLSRAKAEVDGELDAAEKAGPLAERTWREYHGLLHAARLHFLDRDGRALLLDLHGHDDGGDPIQLGYLLTGDDLAQPDATLNESDFVLRSSIRDVARHEPSFAQVVRGVRSLGGLLSARGYPATPSPAAPASSTADYTAGSFSTARYGSHDGSGFSTAMLRTPAEVRASNASRRSFSAALADALDAYFDDYYGGPLSSR